jgi:hypothetical protein
MPRFVKGVVVHCVVVLGGSGCKESVALMVGIRPGLFTFCTRKGLGRVGVEGVCILGGQRVSNSRTVTQHRGK